jgi:hypothetical protein
MRQPKPTRSWQSEQSKANKATREDPFLSTDGPIGLIILGVLGA